LALVVAGEDAEEGIGSGLGDAVGEVDHGKAGVLRWVSVQAG
jgi:hypothetical protein